MASEFANLREDCAKIAEDYYFGPGVIQNEAVTLSNTTARGIAVAIRRG